VAASCPRPRAPTTPPQGHSGLPHPPVRHRPAPDAV